MARPAIGKHLRPSVTAIRRTDGGIEVISRQTLPGGSIGASLPAVALTGVQSITVARGRARQVHSLSNMRQIAMALVTYQVEHAKLPAAYTVDEDGKPLLSWRVTILPYLSQQGQELYDQFHLDEPWDSEHNRKLIEKMPSLYRCTSSRAGTGKTVYLTVRSPRSAFPGKEGIAANDIENPSNTILLVEASDALAVPWTKPADYNYDPKDPAVGLVRQNAEAFNAAFCDGSVRSHSKASDPAMLRAMFERTDIAEHGQSGG